MKSDKVTLSWNGEYADISMGSYVVCPLNNIRYYLLEPYYPKAAAVGYTFTPEFESEIMMLAKIPFLFYQAAEGGKQSVESDWNFTGKGSDLVAILEDSIQNGIGVRYTIEIDESIEASLSLSFSNVDIFTALNNIAAAWDCEWYTEEQKTGASGDKKIYFTPKAVHGSAYTLTGGENIEMPQSNNKATYFNRFFVFGSNKNIPQNYEGAQANHVVNKRLTLNPARYPNGYIDLPLFNDDGSVVVDKDGKVVIDPSLQTSRIFTKVLTFEDIYPRSNCRIRDVQSITRYVQDADGNPIILADGSHDTFRSYFFTLEYEHQKEDGTTEWLPFTINPTTYTKDNPNGSLIKGKTLSLHFKSGALEGREFEATYYKESTSKRGDDGASIQVAAHSFNTKHSEDNTIIIPNSGIEPQAGDEVIVFNINMPLEYYNTAYIELEEKAYEQIFDLTRDSNEYSVKSNQVAFANNLPNLTLGRHITLDISGRTIDTRVTGLTTCLDRRYEQNIKLSKNLAKGTINTLLTTIESTQQKVVDISVVDDTRARLNKQQLYNAQNEMKDAMFDPDGEFQENLTANVAQVVLLRVGADSTNFQLSNIMFVPNYNSRQGEFYVDVLGVGRLVHYGLDKTSSEPRVWNMTGGVMNWYNNGEMGQAADDSYYYLYAVCSVSGDGGFFILDTKQRAYNSDVSGQTYYFLVGVLSSAASVGDSAKSRIFNTSYGTTQINGRQINTGRISSVDGKTYIDLDTAEIHANKLSFTSDGQAKDVQDYINGVVSTDVNAAVGKLNITGRNYILGSNTSIVGGSGQSWFDKGKVFMPKGSISSSSNRVTFSIDITSSTSGNVIIVLWADGGTFQQLNFSVTAGTKRYSTTINLYSGICNDKMTIDCRGNGLTFAKPKLEKGDKMTEFSLAPEDTDVSAVSGMASTALTTAQNADAAAKRAEENAKAMQYLTDSLSAAASGSVDITGGLLLGSFLGVKEGGVIVAGMNGNANSNLPMLFSGRTDSNSNGTFQVWRDGHIVSTDGNGNTIVIYKDEIKFSTANKGDRNIITSKAIGSISTAVTAVTTGGSSSYNLSKGGSTSSDTIVGTYSNGGSSTYNLPFNKKNISTSELQFTLDKPASLVTMKAFTFTASFSMNATGKAYVSGSYPPYIDVQGMKLYVIVLLKTDGGTKMLKQQSVTLNNTTLTIGSQETKSVGKADVSVSAQSFSNMPSGKYSIEIQYAFYEIGTAVANAGSASSSLDGVGVIVNCSHNALSSSGCFTISQLAYGNVMYSDGLFMSSSNNRYLGIDPNATDGAVMKIRTDSGALLSPILLESIGSGKGAHVKITHEGLMHSLTQNIGTYYRVSALVFIMRVSLNGTSISNRDAWYNPFGWSLPSISVSNREYLVSLGTAISSTYSVLAIPQTDAQGWTLNPNSQSTTSFKLKAVRNTGDGISNYSATTDIYIFMK